MPENGFLMNQEFNLKRDFPVPTQEEWINQVKSDLKGADFEKKLMTNTYEGIRLKPIYTKEDLDKDQLGAEYPGLSNNLRGSVSSGYIHKSWGVCQELIRADADEFNRELKNDLSRGQTRINVILDSATQAGIDADYARITQVGDAGLSISGLNSFSRAFKDIDLEKYPLHIQCGFSSIELLSILAAFLKADKKKIKSVSGSLEADPVTFLLSYGELPVEISYIFDKMKTALEWSSNNSPNIRTVGVSGMPYNDAGASAVQELAYTLSTGVEYIEQLKERGLSIDQIAGSMRFTFGIGPFYFMEVAKLRAARVLWSNIMKNYGSNAESAAMLIHGRTSRCNQTFYDPFVNMLRTTTEAFSGIVGGIDSLHSNPFNETFSLSDRFARRMARNIQIILKEESHLDKLIDPAGGSYFVEALTKELAEASWKEFLKIEEMGGMLKAIELNYPQDKIKEVADLKETDMRKRKKVLVGINMYANPKEEKPEIISHDFESFYRKRADFLQRYRVSGNTQRHRGIINKLHSLADPNSTDIIDIAADAILNGATIGEISNSLRSGSAGKFRANRLSPVKAAGSFETLRRSVEEYSLKKDRRPRIMLVTMGSMNQYKARADFSRGFFEVGGFEVIYPDGFNGIDNALKAVKEIKPDAAVICSTDETYPELVPPLTAAVKGFDKNIIVILAGFPKDQIDDHKNSGVDDFIYLGTDAYSTLNTIFNKIKSKDRNLFK